MNRFKSSAALALASTTLVLFATPSLAQQALTPALQTRAREACVQKAQADGFTVRDVVSVAPANADTVNVVLSLDKAGQLYKLTCGYSASKNTALVGDNSAAAPAQTYQPWISPWLFTLLPLLLGLPLLWAWTRGRHNEPARYTGADTHVRHADQEAVVRTDGSLLDVHSGPANSYRVTGNLRNGQQVTLTGRQDNNWVELAEGGWVQREYLDTRRYVS